MDIYLKCVNTTAFMVVLKKKQISDKKKHKKTLNQSLGIQFSLEEINIFNQLLPS